MDGSTSCIRRIWKEQRMLSVHAFEPETSSIWNCGSGAPMGGGSGCEAAVPRDEMAPGTLSDGRGAWKTFTTARKQKRHFMQARLSSRRSSRLYRSELSL